MADKRMFSKSIVLSDAFLDMPATARCLYFTFGMMADDDGFVNSPKSIMRQCGASDDDFKILVLKYFIIPFETGVVVIRQWRLNNYIRCDRYTETKYLEEKAQLLLEADGSYALSGKQKRTRRVAAERPSLLQREPKNPLEVVEKEYLKNYDFLYKSGILKSETPIVNWSACRKIEKDCIGKYGLEKVVEAVRKSKDNDFAVSKGYSLTTILSAGVLAQLINANSDRLDEDRVEVSEIDF